MAVHLLPKDIRQNYRVFEWRNAVSILSCDFPVEFEDLIQVLRGFRLTKTDILTPGGRKSPVAAKLDSQFYQRGWQEKWFQIHTDIDGTPVAIPTHGVDCFKSKVGIEVEWNNKDPFFDRDLNNFRLLFDLMALDVGVIITRDTALQSIFGRLGKGKSYGSSTTHWDKLIPRVEGQGSGGCPLLLVGITERLYVENE